MHRSSQPSSCKTKVGVAFLVSVTDEGVVIFSLPFLLYRAITEDRILQVELAGYSDYAARVR
jgi:protein-S-isoprenylcysteine O-methyltransferase Ste14